MLIHRLDVRVYASTIWICTAEYADSSSRSAVLFIYLCMRFICYCYLPDCKKSWTQKVHFSTKATECRHRSVACSVRCCFSSKTPLLQRVVMQKQNTPTNKQNKQTKKEHTKTPTKQNPPHNWNENGFLLAKPGAGKVFIKWCHLWN